MRKLLYISFVAIITCLVTLSSLKYCWIKQKPTMQYPRIPYWTENVIRRIDRFATMTAGIMWAIEKDVKTGQEYLVNIEEVGNIWIRPYHKTNSRWQKISQYEYANRFYNGNYGDTKANKGVLKKGNSNEKKTHR